MFKRPRVKQRLKYNPGSTFVDIVSKHSEMMERFIQRRNDLPNLEREHKHLSNELAQIDNLANITPNEKWRADYLRDLVMGLDEEIENVKHDREEIKYYTSVYSIIRRYWELLDKEKTESWKTPSAK